MVQKNNLFSINVNFLIDLKYHPCFNCKLSQKKILNILNVLILKMEKLLYPAVMPRYLSFNLIVFLKKAFAFIHENKTGSTLLNCSDAFTKLQLIISHWFNAMKHRFGNIFFYLLSRIRLIAKMNPFLRKYLKNDRSSH